jgi:DNA-directed RNA polymerase specialized sigma24 family protein
MTLRETSYVGSSYGMIPQPSAGFDVELVWACSCGFQLSHEEPAELAYPLSPALRRVAAAAADLESIQWHLDQLTDELESAVVEAADAGAAIVDIAEAAQLEPGEVQQLASGGRLLDVG